MNNPGQRLLAMSESNVAKLWRVLRPIYGISPLLTPNNQGVPYVYIFDMRDNPYREWRDS